MMEKARRLLSVMTAQTSVCVCVRKRAPTNNSKNKHSLAAELVIMPLSLNCRMHYAILSKLISH